jgi:hypothetical protein
MEHYIEEYYDVGQKYKGYFIKENECPECHSDADIEYLDSGIGDEFYFYEMECGCGARWTEFHRLVFDSIRIDQPVNKETDQ